MSETARVVMYGRPGCHLCEQAAEVIARVCDDLGETWVEVSIDDDEALREEYGEEIPVTLVDGRRHDFWRVDEARLRAALSRRPACNRVFVDFPSVQTLGRHTNARLQAARPPRW